MDANSRHMAPELEAQDIEVREEKPDIPLKKESQVLRVPLK